MLILAVALAAMPKHRGNITVAQFCENYNRLAAYYGFDIGEKLDPEDGWVIQSAGTNYVVSFFEHPEFQFTEEDGIMTGVEFSVEMRGTGEFAQSCQSERFLAVLAFVKAQEGSGLFENRADRIAAWNIETPFVSYSASAYGVEVNCEIEFDGYASTPAAEVLIPMEDEKTWFSMSFSLQKEKSP